MKRDRSVTPLETRKSQPAGRGSTSGQAAVELAPGGLAEETRVRCTRPTVDVLRKELVELGQNCLAVAPVFHPQLAVAREPALVPHEAFLRCGRPSPIGAGGEVQRGGR